jgi:predicted ribosome quality control (RQC) complex YloA/Tae2 family protein
MKRYAYVSDLTEEQWEDILDEIIWTFEYIKDDGETMNPYPNFRKDEPLDEYFKREKTEEEKQLLRDWTARAKLLEQRRERGLGLFAKYYIHLWD